MLFFACDLIKNGVFCGGWGRGFCERKTSIWQNLFAKPPLPCMICSLIVIFGSIFTDDDSDIENAFKRAMPWLGDEFGMKDAPSSIFPGLSLVQWMSMQQNNQFSAAQSGLFPSMVSSNGLHNNLNADDPSKLLSFQAPAMSASNLQFNKANPQNQVSSLQQSPVAWPQQQHLQQLLQNPNSQQQQQRQMQHQELHQLSQQQQQQQVQQQQPQQQQRQLQQQQQQQQQQQICHPALVNNGVVAPNQIPNQSLQQPVAYSQLQQQQILTGNTQSQQSINSNSKSSLHMTSLPLDSQFQQQIEPQSNLLQRHQQQAQLQQSPLPLLQQSLSQRAQQQPQMQQLSQQCLSEQQLQFQLLQKMQQQQQQQQQQQHHHQHQQLLSPASPILQPQLLQQQQPNQQNQQVQQIPLSQHQQQQHQQLSSTSFSTEKLLNGNSFSTSALMQSQQIPVNRPQSQHKPLTAIRAHSGLTEGDAPSCSTSPSTNNCQVSPSNLLNRNQQGSAMLVGDSLIEPPSNLIQELQSKSDIQIKHELPCSKGPDQIKYKSTITDQLEASSSGTSYCLDASIPQNFPIPTFGLEGDVQSHPRNNLPFATNIDGLAPDTLLSRGYDSQKDLQNLLSNYGGTPRDIETELSTAAISSQSFGVPNIPFKPGCSSDVAINDAAVLSNGLWANQTQRMRTYTKVC